MRAEQGEHHTGRALGFLRSAVFAAFLHVVEERFTSQSHLGRHPSLFFGPSTECGGRVRGRSDARPPHLSGRCQPEISLLPVATPMEILRGLARSAIGIRRVSTPAS